jgi:hypothetical protein
MLIRFSVTRKDTGAGVPNARIEVEKAETVGFTDSQGKAEIVTYWSGNFIYSVAAPGYEKINGTVDNRDIPVLNFGVTLLYNAISQPPTPGFKEEIIGRVGTSCSIINNYSFAKSAYQVRHDRNGNLTSLHMDLPEIRDIANRKPECFEIPPPPPKTTDELGAEVSTLQKLLNSTVGRIENLTQGIGDLAGKIETEAADRLKGLLDLEARIKAWITTEAADRLKGLLDLEARLKSWISDTILEILLMKLMEGRKYDSRR